MDFRRTGVGFSIPNEFVVGYGLDYAGRYRELPYLAKLLVLNRLIPHLFMTKVKIHFVVSMTGLYPSRNENFPDYG